MHYLAGCADTFDLMHTAKYYLSLQDYRLKNVLLPTLFNVANNMEQWPKLAKKLKTILFACNREEFTQENCSISCSLTFFEI